MEYINKTFETFSFSGKSENCYGLKIVENILQKQGFNILPFNYSSNNPILVSLYWPEQLYKFIKWRYDKQLRDRKIIIGGNYASTSPQALKGFNCDIFLGDGELYDGSENNKYIINGKPIKNAEYNNIIPILYEDIQSNKRGFCEISRGCKNKCLFCQYGWLKNYREADIIDIIENIKRQKTKSIRVFASDRFEHSRYLEIRKYLDKIGKCDTGSDITIKTVLRNSELLKYTNKVRVGIEGMSEKLRKLILKPYTNNEIIEFCKLVINNNIKCLDWYMIYGLPKETDEDIEEFQELIMILDEKLPKGYVIAIHWNAFTPSARTPLQWYKPAIGNYEKLSIFLNSHKNKNIKIYHKPKLTSIWTLIRRMLAIRGTEKTAKLIYNFAINEFKFKKNKDFILKEYENIEGNDLIGCWDINKPLPWDKYCIYQKEKMLNLYKSKI